MLNTLVTILGPTGIGKTDLAIDLALHFGSDVISADSRQFYREMRIGTAVPSDDQLSKVRHHFIRFIPVKDYYSASLFERDVLELLPSLFQKSRIAIMCGGSGLYIDAVLKGIDDIPDADRSVREKYTELFLKEGIESLRLALKLMDPVHYRKVDLKNPKRLIRALEICETTGKPYSSFLGRKKAERDFRIIKIGLEMPRDELYRRINERVDRMIGEGLEDEVRGLLEFRHLNALQSVGYRELFDYFDGIISRQEAITLIKRNSRRFARRQITWWSRDKNIIWFHPSEREEIIRLIEKETE
mgnify:CR=1 FL=1